MALHRHFEATEELVDLLRMGEHGLAFRFVADGPVLEVAHRFLKIVPHIAPGEKRLMHHYSAIQRVDRLAHEILRYAHVGLGLLLYLMQRLFRFGFLADMLQGVTRHQFVRLRPFFRIEEALAVLALELDRVQSFLACLRQDDHIGNHLLHAPCIAIRLHAHVAHDLVLRGIVRELLLQFHIHGVQQYRHLLAFVTLLARFRRHYRLLQRNRLLMQHNGLDRVFRLQQTFAEHFRFLVTDTTDDHFLLRRQIGLEDKITVIVGRSTRLGLRNGINSSIRNRLTILVNYTPHIGGNEG